MADEAVADEAVADALVVDFSIKPGEMVAPGEATMTFTLSNPTDYAILNIYLTSADGLLSEPIGQLAAGETQTLVRPHAVTQEELDAGYIAYTVTHDSPRPGGQKITREYRAGIVKGDARPNVDFTRQLSSSRVQKGSQLTITYKLENTGNVPVTSVRLRDSLGDFTGRMELLGVGESKTFISRVSVQEEAVSAPVLEYQLPSGKTASLSLDPAAITLADSRVSMSFSVTRSVFDPDTADAVLTLFNRGNTDYSRVTVTDDMYGGVIADAIALPSGSSPVEVIFTYPIRGEAQYRWRITGMSSAGEALDERTDVVTVTPLEQAPSVSISLEAAPRTPRINRAGDVIFDIAISNEGTVMAQDARLYEINRGDIRQLAVISAGEPTRLSVRYSVTEDSQFIFCLNYSDAEGRQRTVTTAPIDVEITPSGEPPEDGRSAAPKLSGSSIKPGNTVTFTVLLIIAALALTVMVTILAAASVRARRERRARAAAERQRMKDELGKTNPFTPIKQSGARKKQG